MFDTQLRLRSFLTAGLELRGEVGVVPGFLAIGFAAGAGVDGAARESPGTSPGGGIYNPRPRVVEHRRFLEGLDDQREVFGADVRQSSLISGGP